MHGIVISAMALLHRTAQEMRATWWKIRSTCSVDLLTQGPNDLWRAASGDQQTNHRRHRGAHVSVQAGLLAAVIIAPAGPRQPTSATPWLHALHLLRCSCQQGSDPLLEKEPLIMQLPAGSPSTPLRDRGILDIRAASNWGFKLEPNGPHEERLWLNDTVKQLGCTGY